MLLKPSLEIEENFTSNLYLEDGNGKSDFSTTVRPGVQASIDLAPHRLNLDAGGEIIRHQYSSENIENAHVNADLDFEVKRGLHWKTEIGAARDHESRDDLTLTSPETPIAFSTRKVMTRMIYAPARLQLGVYGGYSDKRFEDNRVRGSGADDIERDRDYDKMTAGARVGYEISPSLKPYADVSRSYVDYKRRDYVGGGAFTGISRDRYEDRFKIGADFELARNFFGHVDFGFGRNTPDDSSLGVQNNWIADAALTWKPNVLTSVTFTLNRYLDDDNQIASGLVSTRTSLNVRHALSDEWGLSAGVSQQWRDYQNSARADQTTAGHVALDYALNRYLALVADIGHALRNADGGTDYAETTATIRVRGQI